MFVYVTSARNKRPVVSGNVWVLFPEKHSASASDHGCYESDNSKANVHPKVSTNSLIFLVMAPALSQL